MIDLNAIANKVFNTNMNESRVKITGNIEKRQPGNTDSGCFSASYK